MNEPNKIGKVTWAQAVRDVLITAMNRGQLPILLAMIGCIFILYSLPSGDLSKLVFRIIEGLESFYLVGYFLVIIIGILWYADAKKYRRLYADLEKEIKKTLPRTPPQHNRNKE